MAVSILAVSSNDSAAKFKNASKANLQLCVFVFAVISFIIGAVIKNNIFNNRTDD